MKGLRHLVALTVGIMLDGVVVTPGVVAAEEEPGAAASAPFA